MNLKGVEGSEYGVIILGGKAGNVSPSLIVFFRFQLLSFLQFPIAITALFSEFLQRLI